MCVALIHAGGTGQNPCGICWLPGVVLMVVAIVRCGGRSRVRLGCPALLLAVAALPDLSRPAAVIYTARHAFSYATLYRLLMGVDCWLVSCPRRCPCAWCHVGGKAFGAMAVMLASVRLWLRTLGVRDRCRSRYRRFAWGALGRCMSGFRGLLFV